MEAHSLVPPQQELLVQPHSQKLQSLALTTKICRMKSLKNSLKVQAQILSPSSPRLLWPSPSLSMGSPTFPATASITKSLLLFCRSRLRFLTLQFRGLTLEFSFRLLYFSPRFSSGFINNYVPTQCEVKNTSEYRLLPGPVFVILDDSYVSKTTINVSPIIRPFIFTIQTLFQNRMSTLATTLSALSEMTHPPKLLMNVPPRRLNLMAVLSPKSPTRLRTPPRYLSTINTSSPSTILSYAMSFPLVRTNASRSSFVSQRVLQMRKMVNGWM